MFRECVIIQSQEMLRRRRRRGRKKKRRKIKKGWGRGEVASLDKKYRIKEKNSL